jgi:hypothetical protein
MPGLSYLKRILYESKVKVFVLKTLHTFVREGGGPEKRDNRLHSSRSGCA